MGFNDWFYSILIIQLKKTYYWMLQDSKLKNWELKSYETLNMLHNND